MLIIGREVGQSVIIGDQVKVTAVQAGSEFFLSIEAPLDVSISRTQQGSKNNNWIKGKSRKIGETVIIGDLGKVTILRTESGLIRLAIDAPREVSVYREELYRNMNQTDIYFDKPLKRN